MVCLCALHAPKFSAICTQHISLTVLFLPPSAVPRRKHPVPFVQLHEDRQIRGACRFLGVPIKPASLPQYVLVKFIHKCTLGCQQTFKMMHERGSDMPHWLF